MIKLFEKFSDINEVKEIIFLYAVETYETEIIDFFIKKGYDINTDEALYKASYDSDTFKYMLENGADIEKLSKYRIRDLDVQKTLIDYGHEYYIYKNIGFHPSLQHDSKYADVVQRFKDMEKYNI